MDFKLSTNSFSVTENEKTMRFTTVAGFVGIPTDKTPSVGGKSGWKFMLAEEGADEAVKGLVGMGVNCCWHSNKEFAKHDKAFKIGVIEEAHIKDNLEIICSGYIWKHDFPDVCEALKEEKALLGASVELSAGSVEDDEANKIRIAKEIDFTGLSIVYKDKAAFYNTNFMCSVLEEKRMTEQEIKDALTKQSEDFDKKITELSGSIADTVAKAVADAVAGIKTELAAKEPEKKPEDEPKADLSAEITKAIADGFATLKADLSAKPEKKDEPERKTKVDFSAFERYGKDKNMMELSAEIDKDDALSAEQKWATKLSLWQKSQHEA